MIVHAQAPAETERPASPAALWRHIFGEGQGFLCLFSGRRPAPGDKHLLDVAESYWPYPQSLAFAEQEAYQQDALGREVYFCAHLLRRKRRVKASAGPIDALWVDGDGTQVPDDLPAPSAVIESSPGRQQYLWGLSEPVEPAEAEALNRRLAYAIGADKGGWDLTQLLRVPGCTNHKYPDAPIVALDHIQSGAATDAAALDALLPPAPAPVAPPPPEADDIGDTEPPVRLGADGLAWWRGERVARKEDGSIDRSRTLWAIACALWEAGASRGTVVAALTERDGTLGHGCFTGRPEEYARIAGKLVEAPPAPTLAAGDCETCAALRDLLARERSQKEEIIALNRAILGVLAKKGLKQLGRAAIGIALDVQERLNNTQETEYTPEGQRYVCLNNGTAGEKVGFSDDTIGKASDFFEEKGLLHKTPKSTYGTYRDRSTGELKQGVITRNYVAFNAASAVGFLEGVEALDEEVKWGGKQKPRPACEEHPEAGTITRTTVHCAMEACDEPLAPPHETYFTPDGEQAERPLWTLIRDGATARTVDPWDVSPENPQQNEETATCGRKGTENDTGGGVGEGVPTPQLAGTPSTGRLNFADRENSGVRSSTQRVTATGGRGQGGAKFAPHSAGADGR
jgi:hypothetical protein